MKRFYAIVIILFCSVSLFANVSSVDFTKLPPDEHFQTQLSNFIEYSKYVSSYTYEWNHPISRDEVIKDITQFEATLSSLNQDCSNCDIALLHIICLRYMYNLDIPDAGKKATSLLINCTSKYPLDYRFNWIKGNFLCSKTEIQDGLYEFIDVLKRSHEINIHPSFLEDFAYCCMLGNMCFNGIYALSIASQMRGINITDYKAYKHFCEEIEQFDTSKKYEREKVWSMLQDRKKIYYLTSTAFGTSIPIDNKWKFNYVDFDGTSTTVVLKPEKIKSDDGKEIGVSIIINLNPNIDNYDKYVSDFTKQYNIENTEEITVNNNTFKIFHINDSTKYQHMGGARTVIAFTTVQKSKYSNISTELPMNLPKNDENQSVGYFRPNKKFARIDKNVMITFILDSCNDVYTESYDIYKKLLKECIFE